jgi:hypothetical protein
MYNSTDLRILHVALLLGKKAKKGKKHGKKLRRANTAKWRKNETQNERKAAEL